MLCQGLYTLLSSCVGPTIANPLYYGFLAGGALVLLIGIWFGAEGFRIAIYRIATGETVEPVFDPSRWLARRLIAETWHQPGMEQGRWYPGGKG